VQAIRVRIFIVVTLLVSAMGVAGMIYLRGGFSLAARSESSIGYCGTTSSEEIIKNTEGRSLFSVNCASCHAINKNLTGPALTGFDKRISPALFILFLREPKKAYKKSNYLRQLTSQWYNNAEHYAFPNLSEKDIASIGQYIKEAGRQ
jgi:mono/diheme cytochrome c family protein